MINPLLSPASYLCILVHPDTALIVSFKSSEAITSPPQSVPPVIIGTQSGGTNVGIWYTTDGGDNWIQSATGPTEGIGVTMTDAKNGYMLDGSGNIYITPDGGINWTDTTFEFAADVNSIIASSSNTSDLFGTQYFRPNFYKYDDVVGTAFMFGLLSIGKNDPGQGMFTNLIVGDNGNIYGLHSTAGEESANANEWGQLTLWKIQDGGTAYMIPVGIPTIIATLS